MHIQCPTDHSTLDLERNIKKALKNHTREQSQFVTEAEKQTKEFCTHIGTFAIFFPSVLFTCFLLLSPTKLETTPRIPHGFIALSYERKRVQLLNK